MGRGYSAYSGTRIGREMDDAISKLNYMAQQSATLLTRYDIDINQTIAMLFPDEIIAKATAAKNIVNPKYNWQEYENLRSFNTMGPLSLSIDFEEGARCLPIQPHNLMLNHERAAPLATFVQEVEEIYLKYEEVKAVLKWLNKNASIGAMRHYFPTIMKLCPQTFAGMEAPKRHETPPDISKWLQPIRDAATTVASAVLIPDETEERKRGAMWLTFPEREVTVGNEYYTTDRITFNA